MKHLSKFLPFILAGAMFFAGRWSSPDESKELERKYELERKTHLNQIHDLNRALIDRDKVGQRIIEKMYSDSVASANALRANKEAYLKLKKKYNEINLSRSSAYELDSIVTALYH